MILKDKNDIVHQALSNDETVCEVKIDENFKEYSAPITCTECIRLIQEYMDSKDKN